MYIVYAKYCVCFMQMESINQNIILKKRWQLNKFLCYIYLESKLKKKTKSL